MHIMEGYLPAGHAVAWGAASAPFVGYGIYRLKTTLGEDRNARLLLTAAAGFSFLLSALKLPSVSGSSSHPTGIGLGSVLFGPSMMFVVGSIVLLFQALLLAHGGLTTLGANIFAMAIIGALTTWSIYRLAAKALPFAAALFLAAALGNIATYATTALQLALAFPDPISGFAGAYIKFATLFALTQVPIALIEGALTVAAFQMLRSYALPLIHLRSGGIA